MPYSSLNEYHLNLTFVQNPYEDPLFQMFLEVRRSQVRVVANIWFANDWFYLCVMETSVLFQLQRYNDYYSLLLNLIKELHQMFLSTDIYLAMEYLLFSSIGHIQIDSLLLIQMDSYLLYSLLNWTMIIFPYHR